VPALLREGDGGGELGQENGRGEQRLWRPDGELRSWERLLLTWGRKPARVMCAGELGHGAGRLGLLLWIEGLERGLLPRRGRWPPAGRRAGAGRAKGGGMAAVIHG
jgi:hypothetical protein